MPRRLVIACVALALGAPAVCAGELRQARDLVEAGRYPEAIARYAALIETTPGDDDLLIEAARVNAWADRHPESERLYQRVLEVAPHRRRDVLLALAWQIAWGGRPAEAIALFQEVAGWGDAREAEALRGLAESLVALGRLEEALEVYRGRLARQPDDLDARKGEARMLVALDRYDEAAARYRAILVDHPSDREARQRLAQALNDRGRHLAAVRQYQALVGDDPVTAEAVRLEHARTLRWAGLDERAARLLGDLPGGDALRQRLRHDTAPALRLELGVASDSDDLHTGMLLVGWRQPVLEAGHLESSLSAVRLAQDLEGPAGKEVVHGRVAQLGFRTRLGDEHSGLLWPSLSLGLRDFDGWSTPLWEVRAKWVPDDLWRVDWSAGNEIVENLEAIENQVELVSVSASVDRLVTPRWMVTLGGAVQRFDDGNWREKVITRAEHRIRGWRPRISAGVEAMAFHDSDPEIDRGYYNPERYGELRTFARLEHEAAGWDLGARIDLGYLREEPGGNHPLYAWEVSASRDLGRAQRIRLYAGRTDSDALLGAGEGYSRTYAGLTLVLLF